MQLLTATKDRDLVIVEMAMEEWEAILSACGVNIGIIDAPLFEENINACRLLYKKQAIVSHANRLHALLADFIASGEVSP